MVTHKKPVARLASTLFAASALFLLSFGDGHSKTKNPPGCKNSSPSVHNPNCSGGSGTHVPAVKEQKTIKIETTTHNNDGGGVEPTAPPSPTNQPASSAGGTASGSDGGTPPPSSATVQPATGTGSVTQSGAGNAPPSATSATVQPGGTTGTSPSGSDTAAPPPNTATVQPATGTGGATQSGSGNAPPPATSATVQPGGSTGTSPTGSDTGTPPPSSATVQPTTGTVKAAPTVSADVAPSTNSVTRQPAGTTSTTSSGSDGGTPPLNSGTVQPTTGTVSASQSGSGEGAPSPAAPANRFAVDVDHGEKVTGYDGHIVPTDPLHSPALVPHLGVGSGEGFVGNDTSTLPSRIQPIGPTDISEGEFASPADGYRHSGEGSAERTGGQGDLFVHVQRHAGTPQYNTHVPPKPGKNYVPGYRAYLVSDDGKVRSCVMSGMGRRTVINQFGQSASYGHAETIHFRSSSTAHLPSNHQLASRCLISVQKEE